jgi:hypothetical protein
MREEKITLFATNKRTIAEIVEEGEDGSYGYDCPTYIVKEIKEQQ